MVNIADEEPRYKGDVLNCIRNGNGSYKYEIGGNGLFSYDGPWVNGSKSGLSGKFTMKGMHQITGNFDGGEISGHGVKTWSDGRRYEGEWLIGEMHGQGNWISSNGNETYTGTFMNNKREGFGTLEVKRPSSIYNGSFSLHRFNGAGTYHCKNKLLIEALFIDNFIQGKAVVLWMDVANFKGFCVDGKPNGLGRYFAIDQSYEYDGLFDKGLPLNLSEASYVNLELDRSTVVVIVEEIPVEKNAKKAVPKKEGSISTAPTSAMTVQLGCEIGRIVIRAGTERDIELEKLRVDELIEVYM